MASKEAIDTITRPEVKEVVEVREPARYKVIMLNDNVTTMGFVVELICKIFNKSFAEADAITWRVHRMGRALCGIYTREIAEAKVSKVHMEARAAGYPLRCIMEKD